MTRTEIRRARELAQTSARRRDDNSESGERELAISEDVNTNRSAASKEDTGHATSAV
jgi:hypothetical protein